MSVWARYYNVFMMVMLDYRGIEDSTFSLKSLKLVCVVVQPIVKDACHRWTRRLRSSKNLPNTAPNMKPPMWAI